MKRKLIAGERLMYVDAETPLNCAFAVKIRGVVTYEKLRSALLKMQKKHPLLHAGVIEDNPGTPYFLFKSNTPEIPIRIVDRRTEHDWKIESQEEWKKQFDKQKGPLARVVWLRSDEVSELILVCAHCICDGVSFVALMREMLLLLDQPDKEIGSYSPFHSIHEFIPTKILASKLNILKGEVLSVLAKLVLFLKSTEPVARRGRDYVIHWKLNEEESSSIALTCKAENTSVHAALCVAFMMAFQYVKGNKANGKLVCPVDIRKFIPQIKNDTLFAFAPVANLSIDKDLSQDFWAKARTLKENLSEKIARLKVPELLMMCEYFHPSVNKMVNFMKRTNGTHDVTFSNMGRLDIPNVYNSFDVETIYSPTVAFPWRNTNTIVTTTFKGQMDFTFMSNDDFLTFDEALSIKEKAMDIIIEHLSETKHNYSVFQTVKL